MRRSLLQFMVRVAALGAAAFGIPLIVAQIWIVAAGGEASTVTVRGETPLHVTDEGFLSVSIDSSLVFGGAWWTGGERTAGGLGTGEAAPLALGDERLRAAAARLAPAYLRIGGTAADLVTFEPNGHGVRVDEDGTRRFGPDRWRDIHEFTRAAGLDLVFTVGAGQAARDAAGRWRAASLEPLLDYAAATDTAPAVWEFGNEPNGHAMVFGSDWRVTGEAYAADMQTFRDLVTSRFAAARLSGPGSNLLPLLGEHVPITPRSLARAGALFDVVAWHFYPLQSRRCPYEWRRPTLSNLLGTRVHEDAMRALVRVRESRDAYAGEAALWLGETASAMCGGQSGLSDTFASSLWWAEHLARMARGGADVVVRQALVGADYGLIDEVTYGPRPDYWVSVLWKRLMGARVLDAWASAGPLAEARDGLMAVFGTGPVPRSEAFAHCLPGGGGVTYLLLNPGAVPAAFRGLAAAGAAGELRLLTASHVTATTLRLNGVPVSGDTADETLAAFVSVDLRSPVVLPARSLAFVTVRGAAFAACALP
jgi:heparanase 1